MVFCENCGKKLDGITKFCQECGQKVSSELMEMDTSDHSPKQSIITKGVSLKSNLKRIVPEIIVPCEGEKEVKQYHCTHLKSRLLALKAEGVLQVTNKRAIFRASGSSITGNSIIQSEVPIEDISGISMYKGTYFSLKHFILAVIAFLLINPIFSAVLGIFSLSRSFSSSANSNDLATTIQVICAILGVIGIIAVPRKYIWNSILGGISTVSFFMVAGGSLLSSLGGGLLGGGRYGGSFGIGSKSNMAWIAIFGVITLIYTIVAIFLYARRLTMSLSIGSKGGSSTPIYISGVSSFGIANSAAPKAIEAEPTDETEELIRELGAMIMDIQKLGDYGIERWTNRQINE